MKKIFLIASCFVILSIAACKRTVDSEGGTWTFGANKYEASFSDYVRGSFVSSTVTNDPTGTLALSFEDTLGGLNPILRVALIPPHLRTYPITSSFPPDSGYVYINFSDTSATVSYSPSPHSHGTVTVSMSGTKVVMDITPIMMRNGKGDSALLQGHLIQTLPK